MARRRLKMIGLDLNRLHLDSLLAPLSAFVVFLFLRTYLESLLQTPRASLREAVLLKKQQKDVHQEEPSLLERQTYTQHGLYITDTDTAFLTKVVGCEGSSHVVEQKAHHGRRTLFDAVFLICSAAHNLKRRQTARHIYGNFQNTQPYRIKIVFLVGIAKGRETEDQLSHESLKYGDILQGNFVEHYFNLSYKTIMGYRWAQRHCRDVRLVCKIDDDVFVDVFKFFDYFLPIISIRKRVIYGYLNSKPRVHRRGKYWVGEDEFSGKQYPQFCNGFFVVATQDVIADLYQVSKTVRFFRLEDVFTYGMVRETMLDVQLVHVDAITHYFNKYQDCVNDHKYRCKYLAAEMAPDLLLEYHSLVMEHRRMLALPGGPN
ncbi:beta-1,3-galactosyltransferase 1-like [Elysia marginata]|uniref:Hexosyltransferase n=1 Tax=Elysia marginata TaxID=1093978 RepID=A0AAV4GLX0_9GAST|nr:beta-1,3-galactosyltransferase 1-like [Elysia marginata]